jgi:hypothetical protein
MENTIEQRQQFILSQKTLPFTKPYYTYNSIPKDNLIYCSYDNLQGTLYDFTDRNRYLIPKEPFSEINFKEYGTTTIFNFKQLQINPFHILQLKEEAKQIVNELIDLWITTEELDLTQIKPATNILNQTPIYQLIINEITIRNLEIIPIDKSGLRFKMKNYFISPFKQ